MSNQTTGLVDGIRVTVSDRPGHVEMEVPSTVVGDNTLHWRDALALARALIQAVYLNQERNGPPAD